MKCLRTKGCTLDGEHTGACLPFGAATVLTPARRAPRCDGDHAAPACADPFCWQVGPPAESAAALVGEVGPTRIPVDIPPGAQGLVVGPDEVLVIGFAVDLNPSEMRALRAQLEERLPPARFVIVAGYNAHLAKVQKAYKSDRGEITNGVLRPSLPAS